MSNQKAARDIGRNRKQTGQGMVEYIIIVGLVGIGAVGLYSFFGKAVQQQTAAIANGLAGQGSQAQEAVKEAASEGDLATAGADQPLGLDNYTKGVISGN